MLDIVEEPRTTPVHPPDVEKEVTSGPVPQIVHLHSIQDRLSQLLRHMSDAADLALKVEATSIPEQAPQQFLEDYYCLSDPAGTAARHEKNREFDEEWDDMAIN